MLMILSLSIFEIKTTILKYINVKGILPRIFLICVFPKSY